jgi:hypothetical protein
MTRQTMKNKVNMIKIIAILLCSVFIIIPAKSSDFISWDGEKLTLDNGFLQRIVQWDRETGSFANTRLQPVSTQVNFTTGTNNESHFLLDGESVTGQNSWKFLS